MKPYALLSILLLSYFVIFSVAESEAFLDPASIPAEWAHLHLRIISDNFPFLSPPAIARALAYYSTAMYDATVPYNTDHYFSHEDTLMDQTLSTRPLEEHTDENRAIALSFAALRILETFWAGHPAELERIYFYFEQIGLDRHDIHWDAATPSGIGNIVAAFWKTRMHFDGMNQYGDEPGTPEEYYGVPYVDYTNYHSLNEPQPVLGRTNCSELTSINHWQPLRVPTKDGGETVRSFLAPYMARVLPFALHDVNTFYPYGPPYMGGDDEEFIEQFTQVLEESAKLNDRTKMIAEYWADGPDSTAPPGHWHDIALRTAEERGLNLQDTVELLMAQGNAVFDAGIIAWDVKRFYDSARPVTVIQCLFEGEAVTAWAGPYEGIGIIDGSSWQPYQDRFFVTPPFAEYISGHSTFSAASTIVLRNFFRSDYWGRSVTFKEGESLFEPKIEAGEPGYIYGKTDVPNKGPYSEGYVPATDITLNWRTFSDAALEAGASRIYGGIHIKAGNEDGLAVGRVVGEQVWEKVCLMTNRNCDHLKPDPPF